MLSLIALVTATPPPPLPAPPPMINPAHVGCPVSQAVAPPPAPSSCPSAIFDYMPTETSVTAPTTLTGCPVTISHLTDGTNAYFKITRTSASARLKYSFNWASASPPRLAFSFARVPYADDHGSCFQWSYHTPGYASASASFGEVTWFEDVENSRDIYHCASACSCSSFCGDGSPNGVPCSSGTYSHTQGGDLYITVLGTGRDDLVSGWFNFEWLEPAPYIQTAQLQAIKSMWEANCWPTLQHLPLFTPSTNTSAAFPNKHWTRAAHMEGVYSSVRPDSRFAYRNVFSTAGGEMDSDSIPFCDWMWDQNATYTRAKVMALTTQSCENITYVRCDALGNVAEMVLSGRGLSGTLETSLFSFLPALKTISLSYNRLSGDVLPAIFASPSLQAVYLTSNTFSGPIPCPSAVEPQLAELSLANNGFTGALPSCLFTMLPRLRDLNIGYNRLTSSAIPEAISSAQQLVTFGAVEAGLAGALPESLRCLRRVITMQLRGNALTGALPQTVVDGLLSLRTFDLGYNNFTGSLPTFNGQTLRFLYLNNNLFSGDFATQLLLYSLNQERTEASTLDISHNRLSGALPPVFYRLLTDAHGVGRLLADGNNFMCDATGEWPDWVYRVGSFATGNPSRYTHSLGLCKPVPTVLSASAAVPSGSMSVSGSNFLPSEELKCRLFSEATATELIVAALFQTASMVVCPLPPYPPFRTGSSVTVQVANYGADFSSTGTQTTVAAAATSTGGPSTIIPPPPPPPPPAPPALEVSCPAAPEPLPTATYLGCSGVAQPTFEPATCNYTHPCEIPLGTDSRRKGCPFRVANIVSSSQEVYLKINRTQAGDIFKMIWNWDHGGASGAPIVFYGFNQVPSYQRSTVGIYYEDYFWSSRTNSEFTWQANPNTYKDAYHCAGGGCATNGVFNPARPYCGDAIPPAGIQRPCIGGLGTENAGYFYITISGYFAGAPDNVGGLIVAQFAQPPSYIAADQLTAIKDLWRLNCYEYGNMVSLPVFNVTGIAPNDHWKRTDHVQGKYASYNPQPDYLFRDAYSTDGFETDSDMAPFCDWMMAEGETPSQTYDRVMAFTTDSCLAMEHVTCDFAGNVEELRVAGRGLRGPLPPSMAALTGMRKLRMGANRLNGSLPAFVWASGVLEELSVYKNNFTGTIPCPTHAEPKFTLISLSTNSFHGIMPACLFTALPRLQGLSVAYLSLSNARIPAAIANSGHTLTSINAHHSGFAGALPRELACLTQLTYFNFGRNAITDLPQYAIDRMTSLYSLDLSYNLLSGPVPHFDYNTQLRRVYLEHNELTGDFSSQLVIFSSYQAAGALSSAHLEYNDLSGPLPTVLYNLTMNAHRLTTVGMNGNHFRCEEGGQYPYWALRLGVTSRFGKCTPVPRVTSIGGTIAPGGNMLIYGQDFLSTRELRCRLGAQIPTQAFFVSSTTVICPLPEGLPVGASYEVAVCNYGDDWYSATTYPTTYVPVTATLAPRAPPPPPPVPFFCAEGTIPCPTINGPVFCLRQITNAECPSTITAESSNCNSPALAVGDFCEADYECNTGDVNNCPGGLDVYQVMGSPPPPPPLAPPPSTPPSAPPAPPPAPPNTPGGATKPAVTFATTMVGSMASFDAAAQEVYKQNVAALTLVSAEVILLQIGEVAGRRLQASSASFVVTVTIVATDTTVASRVSASISDAITAGSLSTSLVSGISFTISATTAPSIVGVVVYPAPPPAPAIPGTIIVDGVISAQTADEDGGDTTMIIGIVLVVLAVLVLAVAAFVVRRFVKGKASSTVVKAVPVAATAGADVASVSSTSVSSTAGAGTEMAAKTETEESKI